MSSIQERLQMKRVPLDKWSTKEKLCLASAVACSGDQNWMSVSRSLRMLCGSDRPNDWFAQKSCAAQYGKLLENVETPKRKKRTASERDGVAAVETPGESILRKLTQERIIELKKIIQEESQQYIKVKEDIILIQSGVTDEKKLREMLKQIEQERAQREKDEQQHAEWLKEREDKKLELERQWRPQFPGSPTATKAPTPPKIKEEMDEDSQGSCKSGTSPLLTSLLKNPNATAGGSPSPTLPLGPATSSPTITNLLTGNAGSTAKGSLPATGSAGDVALVDPNAIAIKKESLSATTSLKIAENKEQIVLKVEDVTVADSTDANGSGTPQESTQPELPKPDTLFGEDSEDQADDLMGVLDDLIPDDLDEILKDEGGMMLEGVVLKDVVESIMGSDEVTLKDKESIEEGGDVSMEPVGVGEEKVNETASKNVETLVESIKSPPVTSPPPTAEGDVTPAPGEGTETDQRDKVVAEQSTSFPQQIAPDVAVTNESVAKQEDKVVESKVEIIPIEDSTSNSPATIPSSDDTKDPTEDSSGQENAESVIVVSDSAKEEEEDDDQGGQRNESSKDAPAPMEDEDSDDKPLASLDVVAEGGQVNQDVKPVVVAEKEENESSEPAGNVKVEEGEKRPIEPTVVPKEVKLEPVKVEAVPVVADEAKAKKEAMEKLASEYDFKDDEEPIVPLSIQKAKEEKHVSEDEVFEDAQETIEEPEDVKDLEPPAKKAALPDDSVLTVTDTDDDSLIEIKIGKAKRDYSRRKQLDEAQKLRDDLPGHSKGDESEGRSLRKLRDRDRSESPFVMLDDEPNEKMKRSYSSTPVMDSIPGSPVSSEDRDYRAWKKSILAVYARIASKNAAAFLKPLPEEHTTDLIYRPMDLSQIKRNIENGNIRTTAEFQRDIMLMCTNAIMLNRSELCSPHAARMLMRESLALIETGMDPKAMKEREGDRNAHKRSSRKSGGRHSSGGRS
ncbi:bromodomain-containing protein 8 [Anopheles ziemanni]|uniref:bromodomain-containing protein 8 n=1 Tax=Anopheles coustani TaxID=139045 RepID=UPI00265A25B6|nr:bromodomain-containing protein 8 [Anopheles coustani]XP_058171539.1 bromodomain-containing protein 8 [Anopheles ziemanni]